MAQVRDVRETHINEKSKNWQYYYELGTSLRPLDRWNFTLTTLY
jgi:hypothetical protein